MFFLTLLNSFMLCFLIMTTLTTTAPTHHLTIGVQGNTPTLIVTSSEIGITPETMAANEKSLKADIITKPLKDLKSSEKHRTLKTKLNKNHSLLNKKEKLQFMAKPSTKHSLFKNDAKENLKTTSSETKTEEYKKPSAFLTKDSITFKHLKEDGETMKPQPQEIDDITPDTMFLQTKKEQNIKPYIEINQKYSNIIKNSTIFTTTPTSLEEAKYIKTTFDVTTLGSKKNANISTPTISQSLITDKDMKTTTLDTSFEAEENQYVTTISSALSAEETIKFTLPPTEKEIAAASTTTDSLPPSKMKQGENLITTLELSTASGLKEITDVFTTTINNDDTSNIATTSKALRDSSTTAISTNDDVLAIAATEKHIIDKETTTIKSENDNDRNTENTTLLRNENLLLTNTQSMTITATTPASHLDTSTTNNAIAGTATITTTTGIDGDDEEQQQALTETSATALNRNEAVDNVVQAKSVTDNKPHRSSRHSDNTNSVRFKPRLENKATISTIPVINKATVYSHTSSDYDETITTENSLVTMIPTTTQEFKTNEQSVIETEKETTVITIPTPLIKKEQQQTKTTMKSIDFSQITPKFRDYDETTATTAMEKVLKLMDLEKHDDLKHSSLSSIQQHHDSGHDGLKNIKKKQLIDKHYVEALLHTKQDVIVNNSNNPNTAEPMNDIYTASTVTSSTTHSSYTTTPSTTPYTKPLLLPIKHGFLGPILMEEKTFHVIHHPADSTNDAKANKIPHLSSLEAQLRNGHFVELKAKAEIEPNTETITTTSSNNNIKYIQETTTVTNKIDNERSKTEENLQKFATDNKTFIIYKDDLSGILKNKSSTVSLEFGNKKGLKKSTTTFDTTVKSANINYFLESRNKQDLAKALPVSDLTVESTTSINDNMSRNENYKSSEDSQESRAQQVLLKSDSSVKSFLLNNDSKQGLQKSSIEFGPQNDLQKLTTILPDTVQSTISNTGVKSLNANEAIASADSLEFGIHKILLKSSTLQNTTAKTLATNKDDFFPQSHKSFLNYSLDLDQHNSLKNSEKVLNNTDEVSNKFYTENENRNILKNTTVKSNSTTKGNFLTHRGLFKDSLDFKPQSDLYNSEKVLPDTKQASQKFYTESENNEKNKALLKSELTKEDKLQKSSIIFTTTVETLKAVPSKDVSILTATNKEAFLSTPLESQLNEDLQKSATVLSTTVFQIVDSVATKTPIVQANTMFNSVEKGYRPSTSGVERKTESKISDIQIEVYDSTIDSIVASTNFKDNDNNLNYSEIINDETLQGKTTKPPVSVVQQERFTQYVIDRTETSTQEPINYSTIQVASGKPEPAAIEIHINVSESFGNESEDLEFSYPQTEYNNNKRVEESYDDTKVNDNINIKIPSNSGSNSPNKDSRSDEILVVEIIDTDNTTDQMQLRKSKNSDDLFISENTPPPPPPPPPYQPYFDRDSDTIFYISNTEVKVGESIPTAKNSYEERKLKLENQFFPANYMASTHPNINTAEESNSPHHLYEEDIILSSNRNQADSLKIYRNSNEPSPPLDVTYVGESIIEVEQSPDVTITTTYVPDQQPHIATQQADVIIQPAILPEISIGVPVIGELPPQIELKEIDFMPNEAQLHRSGIYEENDNSNNNNNLFNNDIDDNTINAGSTGYNSHDLVDNINSNNNNNNNQRLDESSIQYGGDLIDESADGGFDGVEGSYPFGNPNSAAASISASMTTTRKQQPNHIADYAHLYVNYGVNNMRKDELSADVKDSGELIAVGGGGAGVGTGSNEQNLTSFKEFLNKVGMNNSSYINGNLTQTERMSNATAFSVLEDVNDLEDKNTEDIVNFISLAIGLFIVILPVVVTCSMFWALRYLYKKYHSNVTDSSGYSDQTDTKGQMNEDGVEKGEFIHEPPPTSSSPTNSNKDDIQKFTDTSNKPSTTDSIVKFSTEKSSQLDQIPTKRCSSLTSASKTKDSLQLSLDLHSSPLPTDIQTVHADIELPGPNGSITKMTLENNLLIVETEERNDISRVARETKMDYNKDGVFVVEVARGIDSKTIPESPVTDGSEKMLSMFDTKHNNGILGYKLANEKNCLGNEKVQIHSPPPENSTEEGPRSLHQIEEVEEPTNSPHLYDAANDEEAILGLAYKSNTGLSQSDLSITSSNDSNKGYCYGNQALYVVEQNGYSTMSPTGNVALKCDSKDIKDEDHNPENDHYLEHSPDKKDDQNDKEDVVKTIQNQNGSGSKVSEEKSPRQRAGDKERLHKELIIDKEVPYLEQIDKSESVITKALEADSQKDILNEVIENCSTIDLNTFTEIPVLADLENQQAPTQSNIESSISKEILGTQISNKPLLSEESLKIAESSSAMNNPIEPPLLNKSSVLQETPISAEPLAQIVEHVIPVVEEIIFAAPDKFSDHIALENRINTENDIECVENLSNNSLIENADTLKNTADNDHSISENGFTNTEKISLLHEISLDKPYLNGKCSEIEIQANSAKTDFIEKNVKEKSPEIDIKPLLNGTDSLPDIETELKSTSPQNGHIGAEPPSNSLTEMENGYDSIMSLPEPPPTTEEQLNNDLSDQQLDSLPPPPPPEIFNLKDLPPPLTNGTDTDSLPSEESNNFYNTLPPPPPTTLEVTATNGKMHASPLTPPASPPAHFTNNLHAGLCAQPIAVDVNGS